jgi:hypothetical protein
LVVSRDGGLNIVMNAGLTVDEQIDRPSPGDPVGTVESPKKLMGFRYFVKSIRGTGHR